MKLIMFLVICFVGYEISKWIYQYRKHQKAIQDRHDRIMQEVYAGLDHVDSLSGDQFEIYMTRLLNMIGFKHVRHTPFSNDFGLDAIGYLPDGKTKIGFQFKNYKNNVPYKAIEQTVCGGRAYGMDYNMVVTNSYFTKNALEGLQLISTHDHQDHINTNLISLCDRDMLLSWIKLVEDHQTLAPNYNPVSNNQVVTRETYRSNY